MFLPSPEQIASPISLRNTLLDCLSDGSAPPAIFDVLEFVESKLDADHLISIPHVDILHDPRQVRDMSQAGKFELHADRRSRAQPSGSSYQCHTASTLTEIP